MGTPLPAPVTNAEEPPVRYRSLDALRGVCAVMILPFQFTAANHILELGVFKNGYLFVDFFFVLSGFVITHGYGHVLNTPQDLETFMRRRFARLYPLHLFFVLAVLGLEVAKYLAQQAGVQLSEPAFQTNDGFGLLTSLFLAHSLGFHNHVPYNVPSWSISVEYYTYFLFAIAVLVIGLGRWFLALAPLVIGLCLLVIYQNSPDFMHATYDYGLFRGLAGFLMGALTYLAVQTVKPQEASRFCGTLVEVAALIFAGAFIAYYGGYEPSSLAAPFIFAAVVFAFSAERGIVSTVLNTGLFQALGRWSYSIYLGHFVLLVVCEIILKRMGGFGQTVLTNPDYGTAFLFAWMLASIGLAAATYNLVELPAQRWLLTRFGLRGAPHEPSKRHGRDGAQQDFRATAR